MILQKIPEVQNIMYIKIEVAGRVNQSDIIGAVFGQTEEVLGDDLDLRQLQRENKIGRIEVEVEYNERGSLGLIIIPSYMDISNTVLIAAALETIKKIGPCKAFAKINKIENIKEIKIKKIIEHAKKVLEKFMSVSIDSQELIDEVTYGVRMEQFAGYGEEGVPAGLDIDNFDDIIFVETVEELRNLLKYGIKNVVAFEDLSKSKTLSDIASRNEVTVFINKGKENLVKRLLEFADIDSFTKPEDMSKRISDLNSKELFKAIRSAVSTEQLVQKTPHYTAHVYNLRKESNLRKERTVSPQLQLNNPQPKSPQIFKKEFREKEVKDFHHKDHNHDHNQKREFRPQNAFSSRFELSEENKSLYASTKSKMKEGDVAILDRRNNILGQIPSNDLSETLSSLENVGALIVKGKASNEIISSAERTRIKVIVADDKERSSNYVNIVVV